MKTLSALNTGEFQFETLRVSLSLHTVGRSINSDFFVDSFIMVFYQNFFLVHSEFCVPKTTKKFFR